jgi:hypothetical protein
VLRPSSARSVDWLYAIPLRTDPHDVSELYNGKWCIYRDSTAIDTVWAKIRASVYAGHLWRAKVSTLGRFDAYRTHAVFVFTKRWSDEEEIRAARKVLRALGITETIGFQRIHESLLSHDGREVWYCRD